MSIDLTKLSPAPWGDDWHSIEGCCSETDSAFIALARNAFEVMQRRLWFPRFIGSEDGVQRWAVYSWCGVCDLRDTVAVSITMAPGERPAFISSDPFTCLVEADRWYRENVEAARGCTRVAQPQEVV